MENLYKSLKNIMRRKWVYECKNQVLRKNFQEMIKHKKGQTTFIIFY